MKKIIDNKLYDTANAEKLASWDNNLGAGDFNSLEKKLYKTPKGGMFLHILGGAATAYAETSAGYSSDSSMIKLVDEEEAFQFLVAHGLDDIAIELFPDKITAG